MTVEDAGDITLRESLVQALEELDRLGHVIARQGHEIARLREANDELRDVRTRDGCRGDCRGSYRPEPANGWHVAEAVTDFDAGIDSEMPYVKADGEPSEKELAHESAFRGADAVEFGGPLS